MIVEKSIGMAWGVIHVHMIVEAMGTNEVGEGEKYRNKEKEDQGENFEKLYISGGGKVST